MKTCCHCKNKKPLESFNFKKKKENIRQKACRACTQQQVRDHYKKNPKYYLEKAKKRNHEQKLKTKKHLWEFLQNNPCTDCGETDPIVLDFDHQRDKVKEISQMVKDRDSLEMIEKEMKKCEVRCANCHRKKTAKDFGWHKQFIN
jgi:hypothetical protein